MNKHMIEDPMQLATSADDFHEVAEAEAWRREYASQRLADDEWRRYLAAMDEEEDRLAEGWMNKELIARVAKRLERRPRIAYPIRTAVSATAQYWPEVLTPSIAEPLASVADPAEVDGLRQRIRGRAREEAVPPDVSVRREAALSVSEIPATDSWPDSRRAACEKHYRNLRPLRLADYPVATRPGRSCATAMDDDMAETPLLNECDWTAVHALRTRGEAETVNKDMIERVAKRLDVRRGRY